MAAAGVEIVADSSQWAAIGLADSLVKIPAIWFSLRRLRERMTASTPNAVVLIDSGGMNLPLLRMIRHIETKRVYYMPPGSWSHKPRNRALRDLVDAIATPFPWSRDLLSGGRARVEWVGHPVVEIAQPRLSRSAAYRKYALDAGCPIVAVAPGSRQQEMRYILPVLAGAAANLKAQLPRVQFVVAASDRGYEKRISDAFRRLDVGITLLQGMEHDALQLADVAMVCSGTATLEFTCLGTPMAIVYKGNTLTTIQFVLFRGVIGGQWRAGMPNIIAERDVVPEFMWRFAKPRAIAREVARLLGDTAARDRMRADLLQVKEALGADSASERTADMVLELICGAVPAGAAA